MTAYRPRSGKPPVTPHVTRLKQTSQSPSPYRAKKRLGQNFLHDARVLLAIVDAAGLVAEEQVLEIGPGRGALTQALLPQTQRVVAVEIDQGLKPVLTPMGALNPHLHLVFGDFLKLGWSDLPFHPDLPVIVVANIPYYITSPILLKLLQAQRLEREPLETIRPLATRMLLMVQWEVAQRLTAAPGSKAYGSLSILVQYAADVQLVMRVEATSFTPRPAVDSAVVMLTPRHQAPIGVDDVPIFFRTVRQAFAQRRKTLNNALGAAGHPKETLGWLQTSTGIDLGRRAETLSLAEFAQLANALANKHSV
jgi:16S rRNA (adenine1518-N6/adenine1519-N6)-dimethyltransferase